MKKTFYLGSDGQNQDDMLLWIESCYPECLEEPEKHTLEVEIKVKLIDDTETDNTEELVRRVIKTSNNYRFKIGDRAIVQDCEYARDAQIVGLEVEIKEYKDAKDFQYSVDLINRVDRMGDSYALLAESELEPIKE